MQAAPDHFPTDRTLTKDWGAKPIDPSSIKASPSCDPAEPGVTTAASLWSPTQLFCTPCMRLRVLLAQAWFCSWEASGIAAWPSLHHVSGKGTTLSPRTVAVGVDAHHGLLMGFTPGLTVSLVGSGTGSKIPVYEREAT